jgi:fatty-acyl-CoA synthase
MAFFEGSYFNPEDRIMVTLPIYHATGVTVGIGAALMNGATVVLRRKFSASNFWKECIQYKCTRMVYVGELCRFLVNQPPSPLDRLHTVKIAAGNGLRVNVWKEFQQRFGIRCIEFYGSSEGNAAISKYFRIFLLRF